MKIMTFNTQHCLNYLENKIDFPLFAKTIAKSGAEIIGLNEMRDEGELEDYEPQLKILSELSGYENKSAFSICPAVKDERGEWYFCADSDAVYSVIEEKVGEDKVELLLECRLPDGETIKFSCVADKGGVALAALTDAQKEVGIALPIFDFDGEAHTNIVAANDNICVEYEGWVCEYAANRICDMQTSFANRNGIYKGYIASGTGNASVRISIYEKI